MAMDHLTSLHSDVKLDFFSRLTAKELHACKCVSKEWKGLISTPSLRPLHRTQSRRRPLLLLLDNIEATVYVITVTDMAGDVLNSILVEFPVASSFAIIAYTCCELVCFAVNHESMFVCNPSTEELAEVPSSPFSSRFLASQPPFSFFTMTKQCYIMVLGRVPSSGHYKIVRLFKRNRRNEPDRYGCEIFTLRDGEDVGAGEWRLIRDCPCLVSQTSHASVEGAIYWPVDDEALREQKKHILRLDLETETFSFMSGPREFQHGLDEDNSYLSFALQELKGCVCMVNRYQRFFVLDVWVLRDEARGIWIKEHSVDLPPLDHHCLVQGFVPGYNNDDGKLLIFMTSEQSYYYYDISTDTFTPAEKLVGEGIFCYFVYYDNFFSLGTR